MIGAARLEPKEMQDFRDRPARLTQLPERNTHHPLSRPALNVFQEHINF
jgi:hypothetical protein